MAIDTAAKRASVLAFGFPFGWVLPIPDGTVAQADRQHLLGCYGGIAAAASSGRNLDIVASVQPHLTVAASVQPHLTVVASVQPHLTIVASVE